MNKHVYDLNGPCLDLIFTDREEIHQTQSSVTVQYNLLQCTTMYEIISNQF